MLESNGRAREAARWRPRPGPERVLVCLGLVFGGLLLAITPPFQVPDEQTHFYRAFQVSDGGFVAEKRDGRSGGWIPESLVAITAPFMDLRFHPETKTTLDAILAGFSVPLDRSMRQFVGFENTTVQTPISYLPQSLGMGLGEALGVGPLTLLYLGRGANLIASLLVTLLAIRATPIFKWVFVLIALMPMTVFEMASVSADAFTNAVALLFTALILRLALTQSAVDARALAALLVTSLLLCLSKVAYAVLILLFLSVPVARLGGPRRYLAVFAALVLLNAAALAGWVFVMQDVYAPIDLDGPRGSGRTAPRDRGAAAALRGPAARLLCGAWGVLVVGHDGRPAPGMAGHPGSLHHHQVVPARVDRGGALRFAQRDPRGGVDEELSPSRR